MTLTIPDAIRRWTIAQRDDGFDRLKLNLVYASLVAVRRGVVWAGGRAYDHRETIQIVSRRYQFVYIAINKVAHKSFVHALVTCPDFESDAVIERQRPEALNKPSSKYRNYYRFAFVRNPWEKAVICYLDKVLHSRTIAQLGVISRYRGLRPRMRFDRFVEWLCSEQGQDHCADRHWISQHRFVIDETGTLLCDFVGKLENIATDWPATCRRVGMPEVSIPHRHKLVADSASSRPGLGYREYYNSRTRDMIAQRYRTDIEMFGYDF